MQQAIGAVTSGQDLSESDAQTAMAAIMAGDATPSQIAALAIGLKMKGEAVSELVGFATAMRKHAVPLPPIDRPLVDTCGTGGSRIKTMNISTSAAIIASAAGATVAKHGNRGVTRGCGSADVLEALSVNLSVSPEGCSVMLREIGIAFLFAPSFHPAMRAASVPRKEIGVRTIFNLLGPLTNPAGAQRQLIGVSDSELLGKMSEALSQLGCERAVVAHGGIGLDDVSPFGPSELSVLEGGQIETRVVEPMEFGITVPAVTEIETKSRVEDNAAMVVRALTEVNSPNANAVIPSAAVTIWLSGLTDSLLEGADRAREAISSGAAMQKLEQLKKHSQEAGANAE